MEPRVGLWLLLAGACLAVTAGPSSASVAQELVVGNAAIRRTLSAFAGPLRTTRLEANGVQMLAQPGVEFLIDIDYKKDVVTLTPSDFDIIFTETNKVGQEIQTTLELRSRKDGLPPVVAYLRYYALPNASYIQKSLTIAPAKELTGAVLRRVTLELCAFRPEFVPVAPVDHYSGNSDDNPKADLTDTGKRFDYGTRSDFAVIDPKARKGIFFFVTSLFGRESYSRTRGLEMAEEVYVPMENGYETGRATIGAVAGPPEMLYKRFREFLWENYCVMRGKPMLIEYDTRLVERQDVSEQKCLDEMKAMAKEGYFNAFHLGYGWEDHYPLTDDTAKFPRGLPYLAEQAKSMGLKMVYWINPLGSKGQTTDNPKWDGLLKEHPEWCATYDPDKNPVPKGDDILCFTTPYADYVEEKLLRLVNECGAAMFYIDGNDWNVFRSPPSGPYHVDAKALPYTVLSRYRAMYDRLRKANKNLIICLSQKVANPSPHAHRLNTLDQIEFLNGTDLGCLGDRQRRYNQAFIFPPHTMNSGWRGTDLEMPLPQAKYAIISAISAHPQIQGTRQISNPNPELSAYLKRFYAFRKQFEPYFEVYQHVLGFPDGKTIDGEGHIIANKGFIILYNPSSAPQKTILPLDEPGLELKGELNLTDWTELDSGVDMGKANPRDRFEVEIGPLSAKIIGVNLGAK